MTMNMFVSLDYIFLKLFKTVVCIASYITISFICVFTSVASLLYSRIICKLGKKFKIYIYIIKIHEHTHK